MLNIGTFHVGAKYKNAQGEIAVALKHDSENQFEKKNVIHDQNKAKYRSELHM